MIGIIENGIMLAGKLAGMAADYKTMKLSKKAMLRAYYFEVISNLDLLDVIDTDKLRNLTIYSSAVISIVNNLEIQIAAAIVFSNDAVAKKLFDFLSRRGDIEETAETDIASETLNKTILQAIDFTLRKITLLQKLSSFKDEADEEIINKLRIKVRLDNIRKHLRFIKKTLDDMNAQDNFWVV